jgi:hypothetical protein
VRWSKHQEDEALWILQPANATDADESERRRAIDQIRDEVLGEKPPKIRIAKVLEE